MIAQIQKLIMNPKEYWSDRVAEPGDIKSLLIPRVAILIAIPAVANFLGIFLGFIRFGSAAAIGALVAMVLSYALQIGIWIGFGYIIDGLAGTFGAQKDIGQSMKLATGALIPTWLGAILTLTTVSALGIVGTLAGLGYGAYALYLGLPIMNGTPQDKTVTYTIAAIAILFVLSMVGALVVGCPMTCMLTASLMRGPSL